MSIGRFKLNDNVFPHLESQSDWDDAKENGVTVVSAESQDNAVYLTYEYNGKICGGRYDICINGPVVLEEIPEN